MIIIHSFRYDDDIPILLLLLLLILPLAMTLLRRGVSGAAGAPCQRRDPRRGAPAAHGRELRGGGGAALRAGV